ncbi:type II toxin-antitoxin system PemI/MazE family antitoxin [Oceanobacillus sp. CAU 1775]
MSSIRARKQGNSVMITIPSALGVKEGDEFYFVKKDNGAITLIPKVEDHFADVKSGEYYLPEFDVGYAPSKGELDGL